MSYILPNTEIKILSGVTLDNSYNNTVYFSCRSAQQAYFSGKVRYSLSAQSYQRISSEKIRVEKSMDELLNCNYIMIKNSSHENFYVYGFIMNVEYVNEGVSEITYEIDVMQTYFYDCTLLPCYVEREHSVTDAIGENILPEGLDTGEYVYNNYGDLIGQDLAIIVGIVDVNENPLLQDVGTSGQIYEGIYGALTLYAFLHNDYAGVNAIINNYIQRPEAIVTIYTAPKQLINQLINPVVSGGVKLKNSESTNYFYAYMPKIGSGMSLNGYVPKNKKLYTYPYSFYSIDNGCGENLIYRTEFHTGQDAQYPLFITGTILQPCEMVLKPVNYKGAGIYHAENLSISSYPICGWNVDSYQSWISQNALPTAIKIGGGIVSSASAGTFSANNLLSEVVNLATSNYTQSIKADVCKGSLKTGNAMASGKFLTYHYGWCSVQKNYAESIDNFFSRFGYATRKVKTPNISSRPSWNYVKTAGCIVKGDFNKKVTDKIQTIFDNGITFWKNGDRIGYYGDANEV